MQRRLIFQSNLVWYLGLIAILGWVYWQTILPGVGFWGDLAKFQFLGKVLGTPHFSGYPLYIVLNHLFVSLVQKGSLALRSNLLSVCFSLAAILVLFRTLLSLGIGRWVAFVIALTYGLSQTQWFFSLVTEVYTLNILFTSLVIYYLLKWNRSRADFDFYLACFLYALSFGNHLIMVTMLPAFVYIIWVTDRSVFWNIKKIGLVFLFVLIGAAQFYYIVWRTNDPGTQFLEMSTVDLLGILKNPGGRTVFQEYTLAEILTNRLPLALGQLFREYYLLILIAIFGAFQVKDKSVTGFLLLNVVCNFAFALNLGSREVWAFFMPTYLILAIYIAFGLERISKAVFKNSNFQVVWLVIPGLMFGVNYRQVDQSQHVLHARIVEKILAEAQGDALIVSDEYDYASMLWYYLLGEGYEAKNLYSLPLSMTSTEQLRAYLQGQQPLYLPNQRKHAPLGLRVYALWRIAEEMKQRGLKISETKTKYLFEVLAP